MLITPLNQEHLHLKAKMVEFAGYQMPVMYSSVKDEYLAVRKNCGVFDISHMAPLYVRGMQSAQMLESITCRKLEGIENYQVLYNAFTDAHGRVVDDVTIYKIGRYDYMVIANASNREKVSRYLQESKEKFTETEILPYKDYILLALQGPNSQEQLFSVCRAHSMSLQEIYYYEFSLVQNAEELTQRFADGLPFVVSRTGYTGEDGYEILLPIEQGKSFWNFFMNAGVCACGLAARDTLRMEVFYPLYGHEFDLQKTPLQGGIGWAVDFDKEFAGKQILQKQKEDGFARTRGFILQEDGVPRQGFAVVNAEGKQVGEVTSGSFSFTWNKGFGIAYLAKEYTKPGQELFVDIRGKHKPIKTYGLSPYKGSIYKRP